MMRPPVGHHIREWRQRRRLSQLDCALDAEISQRHLSFIESGRALPSREMVLRLAERLQVPLRERNGMLLAAGFAPVFQERALDDPAMKAARRAIDMILKGHEPFPALVVDRNWTLVTANAALAPLLKGIGDPTLFTPPVNVLRLSLHPEGLAPRIANLHEWRTHLLDRLRRQAGVSGDPGLSALLRELANYPEPTAPAGCEGRDLGDVFVPLELVTEAGLLSLCATTTLFGTPLDITLSELTLEAFFPANEQTAQTLARLYRDRDS
jgi:transcriptional regulator with XRE-family HTH domain